MHGEANRMIDFPSHGHLGKKIPFRALPHDGQALILQEYKERWKLVERPQRWPDAESVSQFHVTCICVEN